MKKLCIFALFPISHLNSADLTSTLKDLRDYKTFLRRGTEDTPIKKAIPKEQLRNNTKNPRWSVKISIGV